jgi:hypothetical protein
MRLPWLAATGIGSAVVFTAGWLVAGFVSDTADWSRGTINDLGAYTADAAAAWNVPRVLSGVLLIPAAVGLARAVPAALGGATLIGILGAAGIAGGTVFRRDCLSTEPGCGPGRDFSWHHLGNEVVAPFGSIGLVLALVLFGRAFRDQPQFRFLWRSTVAATAAVVLLLLAYLALRDRAGAGVAQRLVTVVAYGWIGLVAYRLDGVSPPAPPPPRARLRRKRRARPCPPR